MQDQGGMESGIPFVFHSVPKDQISEAILNTLAIQVALPSTVSLPFFEGQEAQGSPLRVHRTTPGPGSSGISRGLDSIKAPALPFSWQPHFGDWFPTLGEHWNHPGSVNNAESGSHPQGFSWNQREVRPGHLDFKSASSDSKVQSGWRNPAQTTVG